MATAKELRELTVGGARPARAAELKQHALRAQEQGSTPACSTRPPSSRKTRRDWRRAASRVAREKELGRPQGEGRDRKGKKE